MTSVNCGMSFSLLLSFSTLTLSFRPFALRFYAYCIFDFSPNSILHIYLTLPILSSFFIHPGTGCHLEFFSHTLPSYFAGYIYIILSTGLCLLLRKSTWLVWFAGSCFDTASVPRNPSLRFYQE